MRLKRDNRVRLEFLGIPVSLNSDDLEESERRARGSEDFLLERSVKQQRKHPLFVDLHLPPWKLDSQQNDPSIINTAAEELVTLIHASLAHRHQTTVQ